jgi:hypothetical protein
MTHLYAFLIGCMTVAVLSNPKPHTYEAVVDIIWTLNETGAMYVLDGKSYTLTLKEEK